MSDRWDETWHRLREWTSGQGPSERLAAQVLLSQGYEDLDPSHPLGGPDGAKDALCRKDGKKWVMAVHFPRGQQTLPAIKKKLLDDLQGVASNGADALAFVTNQELTVRARHALEQAAGNVALEIYHLERITTILDTPAMAAVREQFLRIASPVSLSKRVAPYVKLAAVVAALVGLVGLWWLETAHVDPSAVVVKPVIDANGTLDPTGTGVIKGDTKIEAVSVALVIENEKELHNLQVECRVGSKYFLDAKQDPIVKRNDFTEFSIERPVVLMSKQPSRLMFFRVRLPPAGDDIKVIVKYAASELPWKTDVYFLSNDGKGSFGWRPSSPAERSL